MFPNFMNQPSMMGQPLQSGNPYLDRLNAMQAPQMASQPPRCEIIHVNGENGARSWRMAPNSQCLLLDDTAPIVWLAITDGAGYPTLTPYSITPYQAVPAPDIGAMNDRLTRLEAAIYGKPDVENAGANSPGTAGGIQPDAAPAAISAVPAADGR